MRISIDAMGGDFGPSVTVPACLHALDKYADLELILVGKEEEIIQQFGTGNAKDHPRISIVHATEVVAMDESPALALKKKKDSSMRVALNLVNENNADACVSAGNTGALMATARFVLKMLPGIDRPAICNPMPGINGSAYMLDLGANVDSSAEQLMQFGLMGSILVSAIENIETPKIGLLNIGEEAVKGNERVKTAAELLSKSGLNYIGFVEGDDIYKGDVDVIVCDGFVGNVALKASEGVARMITAFAREEFSRSPWTKLAALMSKPVLKALRKRTDPGRYNGASLLGLRHIAVKSHGSADAMSYAHAIEEAVKEVSKNVPEQIREQLEPFLVD